MRLYFFSLLSIFLALFLSPIDAFAIYDPLSQPNNRVGVHILSPDEIDLAVKLVNNQGSGEWGYVTVPIQATDRDQTKWTRFMKKAADLKIVPIIRVATYTQGKHWLKPGDSDLIDFANFLNELPWPIQNRYVIIFNEVNRPDEFGGSVSPEDYADILNNAIDIFKSRSDKFFILPAGLDNAAPNSNGFMRWDIYLSRMYKHRPEIFNRLDGWTSHSYGNPAFSASPVLSGSNKADSFKYDLKFINQFTKKTLPVFITEAGWSNTIGINTSASFYTYALTHLWSNDQVVAVTPFLLFANTKPFNVFSLLDKDQKVTPSYEALASFASKGSPLLEPTPTPTPSPQVTSTPTPTTIDISPAPEALDITTPSWFSRFVNFLSNLWSKPKNSKNLTVGNKAYQVEIVTSLQDQAKGLSGRESLAQDQGMLFKFSNSDYRYFWMKDMKFDIDIVWIQDSKVIGITKAKASDGLKPLPSPLKVNYVLEVNPNSNIKIGDEVSLIE